MALDALFGGGRTDVLVWGVLAGSGLASLLEYSTALAWDRRQGRETVRPVLSRRRSGDPARPAFFAPAAQPADGVRRGESGGTGTA